MTSDKLLKVTVANIDGDRVNLVFSDNQSVTVSKKFLPDKVAEGDEVFVDLLTQDQLNQSKSAIAKEVLQEILKEGSEKGKKE